MEMKIKTSFMKKIIGLWLEKILYKQQKVRIQFDIREFEITFNDNKPNINLNIGAVMEKDEFENLMKRVVEEV